MGKFDGILFISDMDGTLFGHDCRMGAENSEAIEYFMRMGGMFSLATGRAIQNASAVLDGIRPNVPVICHNGGMLYDFETRKILRQIFLDDGAEKILELVEKTVPGAGIEVGCGNEIYLNNENEFTDFHMRLINSTPRILPFRQAPKPWTGIALWQSPEETVKLKALLEENGFGETYQIVRSHEMCCEILPKTANKGFMLEVLRERLGARMTVAVGDNENDVMMIRNADIGFAPANAAECVKAAADFVTVGVQNGVAAKIVDYLDSKVAVK